MKTTCDFGTYTEQEALTIRKSCDKGGSLPPAASAAAKDKTGMFSNIIICNACFDKRLSYALKQPTRASRTRYERNASNKATAQANQTQSKSAQSPIPKRRKGHERRGHDLYITTAPASGTRRGSAPVQRTFPSEVKKNDRSTKKRAIQGRG